MNFLEIILFLSWSLNETCEFVSVPWDRSYRLGIGGINFATVLDGDRGQFGSCSHFNSDWEPPSIREDLAWLLAGSPESTPAQSDPLNRRQICAGRG